MLKKIIILGLTALFMTACGSNDSDGASSSRGSGECVDVASEDEIGLTNRQKYTGYSGGKVTYSKIESFFLESFTKSSSKSIVYDDKENKLGTIETEYSISNGLMKITKIILDFKSSSGAYDERHYDPYYIPAGKIDRNCQGDTWETEYTPYSIIDGKKKEYEKSHFKYTIEDVNVEKTVTAGTFNTVKVRMENLDDSANYIYTWRDIDTGVGILLETYEDGELVQKFESLDIY